MQNLWGENIRLRRRRKKAAPPPQSYSVTGGNDCEVLGHTLNMFDLSGCTTCMDCGAKIFCPRCIPKHPQDDQAVPVLCERHEERQVQHAV